MTLNGIGSGIVGARIVLVLALLGAYALALTYLRWRGRLHLLRTSLLMPALLIVLSSIPEALVTLGGTWGNAPLEADLVVRAFLGWAGWRGLCLALVLWILGWTLFLDGLETLRQRLGGRGVATWQYAQLFTLYALAMGNLDGFSSWTHAPDFVYRASAALVAALWQQAVWTHPVFPLAYVVYLPLIFAAVCTFAHAGGTRLGARLAGMLPRIALPGVSHGA